MAKAHLCPKCEVAILNHRWCIDNPYPFNSHGMILIWHSKHGPSYFDIGHSQIRHGAYRYLFRTMADMEYYNGAESGDNRHLYMLALQGSSLASMVFVTLRSDNGHEYEGVEETKLSLIGVSPRDGSLYDVRTKADV